MKIMLFYLIIIVLMVSCGNIYSIELNKCEKQNIVKNLILQDLSYCIDTQFKTHDTIRLGSIFYIFGSLMNQEIIRKNVIPFVDTTEFIRNNRMHLKTMHFFIPKDSIINDCKFVNESDDSSIKLTMHEIKKNVFVAKVFYPADPKEYVEGTIRCKIYIIVLQNNGDIVYYNNLEVFGI